MYASKQTGGFYLPAVHGKTIPADAVLITDALHQQLFQGIAQGQQLTWDDKGYPYLTAHTPEPLATETLTGQIDSAADAARTQLAGDPLRAVEYQLAAEQAQAFQAAGYQGDVPPMVAAWAVNGRSAEQSATDILTEAARFNRALEQLRTLRLTGKEEVRRLMDQQQTDAALTVTDTTLIAISDLLSATLNAR